jgi:hypothetical protein
LGHDQQLPDQEVDDELRLAVPETVSVAMAEIAEDMRVARAILPVTFPLNPDIGCCPAPVRREPEVSIEVIKRALGIVHIHNDDSQY